MTTSVGDQRALSVRITDGELVVTLVDGRTLSVPLGWFPRLQDATAEQREEWRLIGGGEGIHWSQIDEDLSVGGLLGGIPAPGARLLPSTPELEDSTRQAFQALADKTVELQKSNLRLTESFLENIMQQLQSQAEGIDQAARTVQQQGERQQQILRSLTQEATNAYSEFLSSALSFYQQTLQTATQVAQNNVQAATQATQQGVQAASQAAQQGVQAASQAAQQNTEAANQAAQGGARAARRSNS